MKSRWIVHKNVEILYCDFSGLHKDVEALLLEVAKVDAEILRRPPGSVRAIADLTGTVTGSEVVDIFKASAATKDHIQKQAVVGIGGVQKILAKSVAFFSGQELHLFDSVERAKDWLADQSDDAGEEITVNLKR